MHPTFSKDKIVFQPHSPPQKTMIVLKNEKLKQIPKYSEMKK